MKRIVLVLSLMVSLGCISTRPELVDGQTLDQQLEAYIDDYVDQVLNLCVELHGKAQSGRSPVDCSFVGDLSAMHLSFPNIVYHNTHLVEVTQFREHWCAASQSKTGQKSVWVMHFRANQIVRHETCSLGQ